jgi:hypothetical protein
MNLDFHYYGTYVAASLAGYTFAEAQTIAHAAQYVDDSDNSRLKDSSGNYFIKDFVPVPTVHSIKELMTGNAMWSEQFADEIQRVWAVFHFLPGNYDLKGNYVKPYEGKKSDAGTFASWQFDDEAGEQFKLMCLPNSIVVKKMINALRQRVSIHDVGLRMHTLADTWAHMYYAGIPAWFINFVYDGAVPSPIVATPYYNSLAYLGHLMNWHDPDYPYLTFTSRMQWSKNSIKKENPSDFLLALKQMTEAMSCVRENREFKNNVYKTIDATNEKIIKEILSTQLSDQSPVWKKRIPEIKVGGKALEVPSDYNPDKWLNDYKNSSTVDKSETDYYKFNLAASCHLKFVKDALKEDRIFLDNVPSNRIIKTKIQQKDTGKYVGKAIYSTTPWPAPYPTVASEAVELEFILPNDKKLQAGTNIKIRTTERGGDFGDKINLGAWSTPALYYYIKDYDLFRQKWQIEQEGVSAGQPVNCAKPVLIKNVHYSEKPYLTPYSWLGKQYLTTSSSKQYWNLNIVQQQDQTVGFVMMLDTSGSMQSAIPMVKIDAKAFLDEVKKGDQFGVNRFSDNAAWVYPTNAKIVTITSYPSNEVIEAKKEIEKLTSHGMTNIGEAITLGNNMIKDATTNTKAFILLSDGEHNEGVAPDQVLGNEPPIYVAGLGYRLKEEYFDKMLAKNTNSRYYYTPDAIGMMQIFNEIRGLAPNSLLTTNQIDKMQGSDYKIIKTNVVTDSGEAQISVVWSDNQFTYTSGYPYEKNFNAILYDPQGRKTAHTPEIIDGGYCIFNLKDAVTGEWLVLIQFALSGKPDAHCTTGVVQFGSTTKMMLTTPNTVKLGEPVSIRVILTDNGVPMENVNIHARIVRPLISVDNALIKYAEALKSIQVNNESMVDRMGEDIAKLETFRMQNLHREDIFGVESLFQPLQLSVNGDYEYLFENTNEAGSYTIEVVASGTNRVTGKPVSATQRRSVIIG